MIDNDAVIAEDLTVLSDDLVVLDIETVGLDMEHDVWEIAYAVGESPINSFQVPHSLKNADPTALELNGYYRRINERLVSRYADVILPGVLRHKTIIGANPSFDMYRLARRWGKLTWKYRMIDVESMAMPLLGYSRPVGLATLIEDLRDRDFVIPDADHSAASDVAATREVYRSLRKMERNNV